MLELVVSMRSVEIYLLKRRKKLALMSRLSNRYPVGYKPIDRIEFHKAEIKLGFLLYSLNVISSQTFENYLDIIHGMESDLISNLI